MKKINIGGNIYTINFDKKTAGDILDKIVQWMEEKSHYASHSGEGIMQSDECLIDAPVLISDIVDDFLKPELTGEDTL